MIARRYRTLQLLGKGEMSVVWLALDTYTQEQVAFKVMTTIPEEDALYKKAQERFLREIQITSSLQHPHILPILDHGNIRYENRSVPYLVSPYIPDGSLADLIRTKPPWKHWSLLQTVDAIMQAAESLQHLHTRTPPIVHEDVKPGNFLFRALHPPAFSPARMAGASRSPGRQEPMQNAEHIVHLYLCDFGISRWKQASAMASEVIGTFAFMSPEQANGEVDCASDQYSLAVMACYLLTGQLPLQVTRAKDIEVLQQVPPTPPSLLNPERISSLEVDAVIARALAKEPEQRFPSVLEFAQALQSAITLFVQEQARAQTEKADLAFAGTVAVEERKAPAPRLSAVVEPMFPITLDPPDLPDERVLDEPLPAKPVKVTTTTGKSEEFFFKPLSFKGPARLPLPARPKQLCWAHDSSGIACAVYRYTPLFIRRDGSIQEIHTTNALQASALCWSPAGRVLAISTQGEIRFWDTVAQAEMPLVLPCNVRTIEALDWSIHEQLAVWVDNQILVYTLPYQRLLLQEAPAPQALVTGTMRPGNTGVLRWSPDGSLLVAGASSGEVLCWSSGRQALPWQLAERGQKVNSLAWSPDGTLLVIAFRDNRVVGWNMRTRQRAFLWEKLPAMPRALSISTARHIAIASAEQRLLLGFTNEAYPSAMLPGQLLAAWSPTRSELATLDEQKETVLVLWRV